MKDQIRTEQAECDRFLHTDRTDQRLGGIGGWIGRGNMSEPTLLSPLAISYASGSAQGPTINKYKREPAAKYLQVLLLS
jgi:hypothetical protein